MTITSILETLKRFTFDYPDEIFYGCAYDNGNLSLNTLSAYERMEKKNYIWDVPSWEMCPAVENWVDPVRLAEDLETSESEALLILFKRIMEEQHTLFPNVAEFFDVLYRVDDNKVIGVEKIATLLSPNTALGLEYEQAMKKKKIDRALELVELITDPNLEIDPSELFPVTLLELAVTKGSLPVISALIAKGADLSRADRWTNSSEILKLLIEGGMELDLSADALISAASENRNLDRLLLLLELGADINAQSKSNETALMRGVGNGNRKIVTTLLEKGARLDLKDEYGDTVLERESSPAMKTLIRKYMK